MSKLKPNRTAIERAVSRLTNRYLEKVRQNKPTHLVMSRSRRLTRHYIALGGY